MSSDGSGKRLFQHVSASGVQRVNRFLLEGLFFYRRDDKELFNTLWENRDDFKALYRQFFNLDLIVDEHMAYRRFPAHETENREAESGLLNEAWKPIRNLRRRLHLSWPGRGARERILVFLAFLRYYEEVLRKEGDDQHYGERDFFLPHFIEWLQQELEKAFAEHPDRKPTPSELHAALSDVFRDLERFRFIDQVDRRSIRADERDRIPTLYHEKDVIQYRAMPGLLAYDRNTLGQSLFDFVYGPAKQDGTAGEGGEQEAMTA